MDIFILIFLIFLNVVFGIIWGLKFGNMTVRFLGSMVFSMNSILFGFSGILSEFKEYIFIEGGCICLAFCALLSTKEYFNME